MKFYPTEFPAQCHCRYKRTKLQKILQEFMDSDDQCHRCVMEDGEYANLSSATSAYNNAARRMKLPVRMVCRDKTLYLLKVDRSLI